MPYGRIIKKSTYLRDQKIESFLVRSGLVVLILLILLCVLIYASRLSKLEIKKVVIEGNSVTSSSLVNNVVNENISGFYFKMFPKNNVLIYPQNRIERELAKDFKIIKKIEVNVNSFDDLSIVLVERTPDMLWCGEKYISDFKNLECYFLDEEGFVYSKAPNFSGNVFLRSFGELDKKDIIGSNFLNLSKYQGLKYFLNVLSSYDLKPESVVKIGDNDAEIYFEEGGRLIYNSLQDVVKLSDNIASILNDKDFKNEIMGSGKALDYIDLRLGNKVYYKFK